jgi:uncharacterized protein YeeX (DUF496 family)
MFYVYYWTREIETNEKKMFCFSDFVGDIGDIITVHDKQYIIDDLAAEYEDRIESENF